MKESFISKQESYVIKAVAVMLMVFHHLFGFPERIVEEYYMVFDFSFLHIETIISYFGKICVGIFAFSSGYGMTKIAFNRMGENSKWLNTLSTAGKLSWNSLRGFYLRYWLVCIVFISYGLFVGVYKQEPIKLLKCVLGLDYTYNGEWWYIKYFIVFLILFPVLCLVIKNINTCLYTILLVGTIIAYFVAIKNCPEERLENIIYFYVFFIGMSIFKISLFDKLYSVLKKYGTVFQILIGVLALGLAFCARSLVGDIEMDFIIVPIFIFGIVIILKSGIVFNWIVSCLAFVGKYSTYIWLVHTFFADYFWQKQLYFFKYSTVIFVICLLLSLGVGIVLEYINNSLSSLFKSLGKHRSESK